MDPPAPYRTVSSLSPSRLQPDFPPHLHRELVVDLPLRVRLDIVLHLVGFRGGADLGDGAFGDFGGADVADEVALVFPELRTWLIDEECSNPTRYQQQVPK